MLVSASMCESSGSHFVRATIETKSGPDSFDGLRSVMTFLTNSRVGEYYTVSN